MSEDLIPAFEKDLLTYPKSDLITMAVYYSVSTGHPKSKLAKLVAEKVVASIDIGQMYGGKECNTEVISNIQSELYAKLNELRDAQDKLNGQIEIGKATNDDFEKIIPQLFSECETELEQIKKCVDSNVDSAKKNIQDKINLIDQYIRQKQQQPIFDDAIIVERPQPISNEPLIQEESPKPKLISGLFPVPNKTNAQDDDKLMQEIEAMSDDDEKLLAELNAMLSDDEDDDEKLLAELEAKLCEKDEDCPRRNGQKVICVTKKSDGKTACISENCIIEP